MRRNIKLLVVTALFAALTYVATSIIRIPTIGTNGYVNIGDVMVLLSAWLLGGPYGAIAAGLGSAMADLLAGYTTYVPGTFVIKFGMAMLAVLFYYLFDKTRTPKTVAYLVGGIVAEIWMVVGYFLYEATLLGYGWGAVASIPSNFLQAGVCLVLANALIQGLSRIPYLKTLTS